MDGFELFAPSEPEDLMAPAGHPRDKESDTMAYRGEDLDLRTPQTWGSPPPDLAGASREPMLNGMGGRPGYGAARGGPIWVDEAVLSACNNAFELAAANRSPDVRLEHLLSALTRLEAGVQALEARGVRVPALRRETAVVIAGELPVSSLAGKAAPRRSDELEEALRSAAAQAYRRNAPGTIEDLVQVLIDTSAELPSLALLRQSLPRREAPVYAEPGYRPVYTQEYAEPRYVRPAYQPEPRPLRAELPSTPTDNIQNARLETLESMVRALSNDLSSERRVFTSALQELQREVLAHRDEQNRHGGIASEGLMTGLHERLSGLERAISSQAMAAPPDLSALNERFATIERALNVLLSDGSRGAEGLAAKVEALTDSLKRTNATVDLTPISHRLDIIEEAVLSKEGEGVREVVQRIERLEEALKAGRQRASEAEAAFASEIAQLREAVERQRSEIAVAVLTPLAGKLDELTAAADSRHTEHASQISGLLQQVGTFEKSVSEYAVKSAEAGAAYAQELGEVHDALMKLNGNQQTLAGNVETWRQEDVAASAALGKRVDVMAATVAGAGQRVEAMTSGFNLIGQRIEAVEKQEAATVPMLETLAGTVDRMHKVTVERYHRRNRVWYWLFGTDDWVAASWPSQTARIAEELNAVKIVKK